ncbi:hypothetical protein D043_3564B, partial [Vibrio parahaemolyticus EKP-021]
WVVNTRYHQTNAPIPSGMALCFADQIHVWNLVVAHCRWNRKWQFFCSCDTF